jgi:hypothetical protein
MCEVAERGLAVEVKVWPREESAVADALRMADMTTGPRGEGLAYDDRLAEILARYEQHSIVGRTMLAVEPAIRVAIGRTRQRMANVYRS